MPAALPELRPRFREGGFRENREEIGNDHPETRGRVLADGRRRRGRPSTFKPEIGNVLIDLVINDDVPIVHAARRLGLGVRTVYDWLQRARDEGAVPELVKWADNFTQFLEWYREDERRVRYLREREAARRRWHEFKASRAEWWRRRLGESEFWRRRLLWLAARGKDAAFWRTVARLRSEGVLVKGDG